MINLEDWYRFLSGYWTKKFPTRPGIYPVAVIGGELSIVVRKYDDGRLEADTPWDSHWWSEPRPALSDPPTGI